MRSALLLLTYAAASACNRAPEEPAPAASTRAQDVVIAPAIPAAGRAPDVKPAETKAPDRCIKALPAEPPPVAAPAPAGQCPRDPENGRTLATAALVVPDAKGGPLKVTVELAKTDHDRERGLMFRTSMAEDHGMLFDMMEKREHSFWMRNTCISLDMLFVDDDGVIVGILENVPTLNLDSRGVGCPSSYVLEMNAGWSRRHGVRPGQKLVLPK
jgi:uncharacterized membrane protein (UPF0127 family)